MERILFAQFKDSPAIAPNCNQAPVVVEREGVVVCLLLARTMKRLMVPNENASCHKMARREMARRKTSGTEELMGAMGIRSLRPGQREAITSIVDGRSTLFVSPTGSGKSLVYQAAAKELPGTGIVVSPLNSLILDQYQQACKYFKGTVDIVNGTRTPTERQAIYSRFGKGLKLLFISPEMFVRLFQVCPSTLTHVSFVTFDEGDTAIQWGERFRADYHRAALIAVRLLCPILVLTATLSKRRLPRMLMHFDIDANNVVWAPSARTNVGHRFVHCEAMANADAMLINIISRCDDGNAAIVYVLRREHADKVHDLLVKHVPPSRPVFKYRGGMPEPVRERQQLGWEQHQSAIMVATVAFSLGINRMDVGLIVQYGLPSSPMDFVQQAGRAARRPDSNGQCVTICCKEIDAQQLSNIQRCYLEETVVKDHVRDICAAGDHGGVGYVDVSDRNGTTKLSILTWMYAKGIIDMVETGFLRVRPSRRVWTKLDNGNPGTSQVLRQSIQSNNNTFTATNLEQVRLIADVRELDEHESQRASRFGGRCEVIRILKRDLNLDDLAAEILKIGKDRVDDDISDYNEMQRLAQIGSNHHSSCFAWALSAYFSGASTATHCPACN